MKKTFIKILSVVLCAVMVLGAAPLGGLVGLDLPQLFDFKAEAATHSGTCGTNLTWSLDTNTGVLNITGTGAMTNWSFAEAPWYVFRSEIKTVNIASGVTAIDDWAFYDCDSLTSVTIGNSVTTIGDYAFYDCDILTSVTIPDSVTTIGEGAFYDCGNLTSVTIPVNVTTIGEGAFDNCQHITSIAVDANNKNYSSDSYDVLFNKDKTTLIKYPAGNSRTTYTIPDSVITIGDNAFISCDSLTSVTIPDSVTTIGEYAFYNSTNLTSVTIPDSLTIIGKCAFSLCYSLTSITVDANNKNFSSDSYGALFNKDKTTLIQYPIGNSRTTYIIPDSVTTIDTSVFEGCDALTSVTIGNSVTNIGIWAFGYCSSLASVIISDSVTIIGWQAFTCCTDLTNVTIGKGVKVIGESAFSGCESLSTVTIHDSVKTIDIYAFFDCNSLTDVYYSGNEAQWNKISIGIYNEDLTSATIHYNCTWPGHVCTPQALAITPLSTTTINYGETLVLQLEDVELPEGLKVEWSIIGNAVTMSVSEDGKECRVTSTASGNVTVRATVVDENGEPVLNAEGGEIFTDINIKSNANFWQKIVSFFKNLFRMNRIIY